MTVDPSTTSATPRRFSIDEYHQMVDSGILSEDDRTELIDGRIIETTPIGSRHAGHVDRLATLLTRAVGEDAIVRTQSPIQLGDDSEPEPDIALLNPRQDYYTSAHPGAEDVLLVIEIADTSLEYDRATKIPLYARHHIPVVWLLNLRDEAVEIYERPDPEGYQTIQTLRGETSVSYEPLGLKFEIDDIFVS